MNDTNPLAPIEALADRPLGRATYGSDDRVILIDSLRTALAEARQAVDALVAERDKAVDGIAATERLITERDTARRQRDCAEYDVRTLRAERDAAREALARVRERVRAIAEPYDDIQVRRQTRTLAANVITALTQPANPDVGERCGECRLGLGVHRPSDPRCRHHRAQPATDEEAGQ